MIPCPIADYDLITATTNLKKPKQTPPTKTYRHVTDYSPTTFCGLLTGEIHTLQQFFVTDKVNTQVIIFSDIFVKCLNVCASLVTKTARRPFAPWINYDIRAAMNERN